MKRYAQIIGLKPDQVAEYKRLHVEVWPDVLKQIKASNITNYSIFLREPENLLFSYYEYVGTDYAADMARMAADPRTQEWGVVCIPTMQTLPSADPKERWGMMEEVFYLA